MKSPIFWSAVLAVLIGLTVVLFDWSFFSTDEDVLIPATEKPAVETAKPTEPLYPVPTPPIAEQPAAADGEEQVTPPPLAESDATLQELLGEILKDRELFSLLYLKNFIQRFVVTVDSLPEQRVSQHHLPVKAPAGSFLVVGSSISPDNAQRYLPYLTLVEVIGVDRAVELYVKFYGLFQEAYRELGYPSGHFNDRFVEVINHLLETPPRKDPLGVVQPLIVYKYADPELEERSAGQKLLLRIGEKNRLEVMKLLKELRLRLTGLQS